MSLDDCTIIELPVFENRQGNLAFGEGEAHLPFAIARVFHVTGIPIGAARGGHAHRALEEVVFCLQGSFDVRVDDGERQRTFVLDDPHRGLYLPPLVWRDTLHFAAGTIYLGLASTLYDETDYIRDYNEFIETVESLRPAAGPA